MQSLGEILRNIREKKGMSMTELAEKIGTSHSSLSNIENNRRTPNLATLSKITKALGLPMEEIEELKQIRNEIAHGKSKEPRIKRSDRISSTRPLRDSDMIIEFFEGYQTGIQVKTSGFSTGSIPTNIMGALIENAIKEVLTHEKELIQNLVKRQIMDLNRTFENEDI